MATMLVKNAAMLATMDDARREIAGGGLFIRDGVVEQVGPSKDLPSSADRVVDLSDHLVLPGLVNTHHHLYQTLTRVHATGADLFTWLKTLYPIWAGLTDEAIYISTITGLAELALSGCTTSSDHLYIFPNDCTLDSQIRAAGDIGLRFHAARGSMSLGESDGGLPPDSRPTWLAPTASGCTRTWPRRWRRKRFAWRRSAGGRCPMLNPWGGPGTTSGTLTACT